MIYRIILFYPLVLYHSSPIDFFFLKKKIEFTQKFHSRFHKIFYESRIFFFRETKTYESYLVRAVTPEEALTTEHVPFNAQQLVEMLGTTPALCSDHRTLTIASGLNDVAVFLNYSIAGRFCKIFA